MTWLDWLKKFFSEPGTVITLISSGALGFFLGTANGVIQKRHGGWPAFFSAMASGTVVAIVVGLAVSDYVKSEAVRCAVIGFCALVSEDILAGFRTLGAGFRSNPVESLFRILDALRGRAPNPPAAPLSQKEE